MQEDLPQPNRPRERRFKVNGLEFAAQEWGEPGGLPVLALHGWLDNCASFFKLAPALSQLHIIALDMAGHGQSSHRPGQAAYSPWDDIQDIFAIADAMGWQRFALLAHSRGAIIGSLAAGTFPERFLGLALIEGMLPEVALASEAPLQLATALKGLEVQKDKKPSLYTDLDIAIKARMRGMFPLGWDAARALTERGIITQPEGFCWSTDPRLLAPSLFKLSRDHLVAFINRIQAPVLLLLGTEGLPKLYAGYLAHLDQFAHVNYQLLEGGHHLHMEQQATQVVEKLKVFFAALAR